MSISRLYKKKRRHFMQIFFVCFLSLSLSLSAGEHASWLSTRSGCSPDYAHATNEMACVV